MSLCQRYSVGSRMSSTGTLGDIDEVFSGHKSWSQTNLMSDSARHNSGHRSMEDRIFDLHKEPNNDVISVSRFILALEATGLRRKDPRLGQMFANLKVLDRELLQHENNNYDVMHLNVDRSSFKHAIAGNILLIVKALQQQLIIPDWPQFCNDIDNIFEECKAEKSGQVASYISWLAKMNPDYWAVSICTVDGQRKSWGDAKKPFCLQSVSKAFNYAIVHNDLGSEVVHRYIGQEPSGRLFNEICLNHNMQPHNPMINAGAIVTASLMKTTTAMADRYDWMMSMYKKFSAGEHIGFNNQTFLSEKEAADRNHSLAFYLREYQCFPLEAKLQDTLDLYFQLCSLETTCDTLALMGAVLANGGINPLTEECVVSNRACRDTLSLMHSCGMYDYSGQFAFRVGLPAKSGVSGAMVVVIPNEMSVALWSPPLDPLGNPVKGVKFSTELVSRFNFHHYDSILHVDREKVDPRRQSSESEAENVVFLLTAAKTGNTNAVRQYMMRGMDLNLQDYDGRTVTHLAASEGHLKILQMLREVLNVSSVPRDRWNRTPLDDARNFGHQECAEFLEDWMGLGAEVTEVAEPLQQSRTCPAIAAFGSDVGPQETDGSRESSFDSTGASHKTRVEFF